MLLFIQSESLSLNKTQILWVWVCSYSNNAIYLNEIIFSVYDNSWEETITVMCCLQIILFMCILCTKYLLGDINSDTLRVLMESVQNNFDEIDDPVSL